MQLRVIVVTDPQTNKQTNKQTQLQTHPQTGPITIHCAAKLSVQCDEYASSIVSENGSLCMIIDYTQSPEWDWKDIADGV